MAEITHTVFSTLDCREAGSSSEGFLQSMIFVSQTRLFGTRYFPFTCTCISNLLSFILRSSSRGSFIYVSSYESSVSYYRGSHYRTNSRYSYKLYFLTIPNWLFADSIIKKCILISRTNKLSHNKQNTTFCTINPTLQRRIQIENETIGFTPLSASQHELSYGKGTNSIRLLPPFEDSILFSFSLLFVMVFYFVGLSNCRLAQQSGQRCSTYGEQLGA